MHRYAEVQNPAPVVCQPQKHVKDLKPDGRHGEEVDRDQALEMVGEKGSPSLRWRVPTADHVLTDTGSADVNAELQEFAVNPRAPHSGFSRLVLRIRPRTSLVTAGRPGLPHRAFQVQNSGKLFRCQAITVSGWTMTSAVRQSLIQIYENHNPRGNGRSALRFLRSVRTATLLTKLAFTSRRIHALLRVWKNLLPNSQIVTAEKHSDLLVRKPAL